jgi:multicomponent Na+:H+ antiporter subunit E
MKFFRQQTSVGGHVGGQFIERWVERWIAPTIVLGLMWIIIARWDFSSLIVGVPCTLLAVLAHQRLRQQHSVRLRWQYLPGFVFWFLWQSLRGGYDVARRTLAFRLRLTPGFMDYPLTIPPGAARVFFINTLSLLPGTLSADLQDDCLTLHALDCQASVLEETRAVELQVARLFGQNLGALDG